MEERIINTEEKDKKGPVEAPKKDKEEKIENKEKKKETKKPKMEAFVNSYNSHLSTKTSAAICRFIMNKEIDQAMDDLGEVILKRASLNLLIIIIGSFFKNCISVRLDDT